MAARQIKLGNLLPVIEGCLSEHQVNLKDASGARQSFYLIETRVPGNLAKDFNDTYDGSADLTDFHLKLAEKSWGGNLRSQIYGTLINTELQHAFAFNRRFADLSKKKDKLEFLTPDQTFLTDPKRSDYQGSLVTIPAPIPEEMEPFDDFSNMEIRYSLIGKKKRKFKGPIGFERNSLLRRIEDFMGGNPRVTMPQTCSSEEFSLLRVEYETPTLNDLLITYPGGLSTFQEELAEKLLGGKVAKNAYMILVDDKLRMKFAANELFAQHDKGSREITFLKPEEALLQFGEDLSEKLPTEPAPQRTPRRSFRRRPMTFRYALLGKPGN
tara:strand:- start:338 stop:1315 length:978 start_codon:yes stop_codon:yes gene_type:complete